MIIFKCRRCALAADNARLRAEVARLTAELKQEKEWSALVVKVYDKQAAGGKK